MDPILLFIGSILILLVASLIVIGYFVYVQQTTAQLTVDSETQTVSIYAAEADIQTDHTLQTDQSTQVTSTTVTRAIGNTVPMCSESTDQTDCTYYITLPKQLTEISQHLKINSQDVVRCMELVGECERVMLVTT